MLNFIEQKNIPKLIISTASTSPATPIEMLRWTDTTVNKTIALSRLVRPIVGAPNTEINLHPNQLLDVSKFLEIMASEELAVTGVDTPDIITISSHLGVTFSSLRKLLTGYRDISQFINEIKESGGWFLLSVRTRRELAHKLKVTLNGINSEQLVVRTEIGSFTENRVGEIIYSQTKAGDLVAIEINPNTTFPYYLETLEKLSILFAKKDARVGLDFDTGHTKESLNNAKSDLNVLTALESVLNTPKLASMFYCTSLDAGSPEEGLHLPLTEDAQTFMEIATILATATKLNQLTRPLRVIPEVSPEYFDSFKKSLQFLAQFWATLSQE